MTLEDRDADYYGNEARRHLRIASRWLIVALVCVCISILATAHALVRMLSA